MIGYEETAVLALEDRWVWDSWYVEHEGVHHAFYLTAPRELGDPALRHTNARIGHSVSRDLVTWTALSDALDPGASGDFDDLATWTGSIVHRDGTWHLFYTGVGRVGGTAVQRVGHAISADLLGWERVSTGPVAEADPRWYQTGASAEAWRDPWVFHSHGEWHMLVTASERGGDGTIGHAVSDDLSTWRTVEPLAVRSGFRQIEVTQVAHVDGHFVLVFCAAASDVLTPDVPATTGTYTAPADGPFGPFHLDRAEPIDATGIYAGRVVALEGAPVLLGFVDIDGRFEGVICDPIPLALTSRGTLQPHSAPPPSARCPAPR